MTALAVDCAFCNKSRHEVRKLIKGPKVCICDECISVAVDLMAEDDLSLGQPVRYLRLDAKAGEITLSELFPKAEFGESSNTTMDTIARACLARRSLETRVGEIDREIADLERRVTGLRYQREAVLGIQLADAPAAPAPGDNADRG